MNKEIRKTLKESAEDFGTPQYVLLQEKLEKRISTLKKSFEDFHREVEFFYSYKTNDLPYLCSFLHRSGIHAEVTSLFELKLALKEGAEKILFNGPGKSEKEIQCAMDNSDKATLIADSFSEIDRIKNLSNRNPSLGIRLRLKSKKGGKWGKFGIGTERFLKNLNKFQNVRLEGLHFHIGSEIEDPGLYTEALGEIFKLLRNLPKEKKADINFIDMGGGFASGGYEKFFFPRIIGALSNRRIPFLDKFSKNPDYSPLNFEEFSGRIIRKFEDEISQTREVEGIKLYLEPGRWLVNPVFHLLTRVLYEKKSGVVLDSGINLLPHILYEHHPVYNLSKYSEDRKRKNLYGNLCMAKDLLSEFYMGKDIKEDDLICIQNIGAYSISESKQFMKPKAPVIAIDDEESRLVRESEDFEYRYSKDYLADR